jgi:hypothetical protein
MDIQMEDKGGYTTGLTARRILCVCSTISVLDQTGELEVGRNDSVVEEVRHEPNVSYCQDVKGALRIIPSKRCPIWQHSLAA